MRNTKRTRNRDILLIFIAAASFVAGSAFVMALGSEDPPSHGHDIEEMNWSIPIIPGVSADQICRQGNCRTSWPPATDTRCDTSGTCAKVCIGSDCRDVWPSSSPTPPTCSGNEILERSGAGWTCTPLNVAGPTRYQCPNEPNSCAYSSPRCNGQIQTSPSRCYGHVRTGFTFCTGCGCYSTVPHSCQPLYD